MRTYSREELMHRKPLEEADLRQAVQLAEGKNLNDWVAVVTVDF